MSDNSAWKFNPIRLVVEPELTNIGKGPPGDQIRIVAEDADGVQGGIVASSSIAPLLGEFVPTSGSRFVSLWRSYESSRGGDCFFWDLSRLAEAIASAPGLPVLRKLSSATTAEDFMHNAFQAQLMSEAHRRGFEVKRVRAVAIARSPDFTVDIDGATIPFEVKVLTRLTGVEIYDDGWRVLAEDREAISRQLRQKVEDALPQAGPTGTIVLAVWCESLGAVIKRCCPDWECSLDEIFAPAHTVLVCRDGTGADCWFRFPVAETVERLAELDRRLAEFNRTPFSVSFSSSIVSVTKSNLPMSMGRVIKIANFTTPLTLSEEQLAPYLEARPFQTVHPGRWHVWRARWKLVEQQVTMFDETSKQMERKKYSAAELVDTPSGFALYVWSATLLPAIVQAFEGDAGVEAPISGGPLAEDYQQVQPLLNPGRVNDFETTWLSNLL